MLQWDMAQLDERLAFLKDLVSILVIVIRWGFYRDIFVVKVQWCYHSLRKDT